MSLQEAKHWIKKYKAFLAHNKDVLNEEGLLVSMAILDGSLDPKLATKLRNHTNEAGEKDVKDDNAIDQCLEKLKDLFLDSNPV